MEWRHYTYSYTQHSLSALVYKYKLTVAHLSLIQMRQASSGRIRLKVQLQTNHGVNIPLASIEMEKDLQESQKAMPIAQSTLAIPVKVACTGQSVQTDNALLLHMTARFWVSLHFEKIEYDLNKTMMPILQIRITLQHSGELLYSGLVSGQSVSFLLKK